MQLHEHFRRLARYNRVANERLYERCAKLDAAEYYKQRPGSFGSIHALLNHLLLADQVWMSRFREENRPAPALDTILYEEFAALRAARTKEDAAIVAFFAKIEPAFFDRVLHYTNSKGKASASEAGLAVGHFFNHQTHHRGQIHVMLAQTPVAPPALDIAVLLHT